MTESVRVRKLTSLIPPGRREDSEDAGTLPNRMTVTSTLRFRPRSGDNSEKIACEAQHPALTREPLRASVKMFVQCKLSVMAVIASVFTYNFFCFQILPVLLRLRATPANRLSGAERPSPSSASPGGEIHWPQLPGTRMAIE